MCGIVGFLEKNGELNKKTLENMLGKIKHRGPDNSSIYIDKKVHLGHARLSIIDLSDISNQPMEYKHLTIVFNGEIYNYLELREKLRELGHTFITNGDTEVILHAYEQWGEECQNLFRGMWAFVIYDSINGTLFGSRDRFGIKPLYFVHNDNYFAFSSEIKPLLTLDGSKPSPNMEVVSTYLMTSISNYDNQTFFSNISQIEGGHSFYYNIEKDMFNVNRYYDLTEVLRKRKVSQYIDIEDVLNDTFKLHVQSDVLVGTCLSGGVDSSIVTSVVSELIPKDKVYSVTAKSELSKNDESYFANIVANHTGVKWETVEPSYDFFNKHIEECLYYQEEPVGSPSIFMQYTVMQKAKELGIKVMMDGQGGDESFLGYERYYSLMLSSMLKKGKVFSFGKTFLQITKYSKLNAIDLLKQYIYFNNINIRKKHLKNRYKGIKKKYSDYAINNLIKLGYGQINLKEMQVLELTKTNLPTLLKYEDRNSMLASIEARVPFVDHEVIEMALQLPLKEKIRNGYTKFGLRKYSEKILPNEISWRRDKKGFEAPNDLWLSKHKEIMRNYILNSNLIQEIYEVTPNIEELRDEDTWKLFNLALWEKQYLL